MALELESFIKRWGQVTEEYSFYGGECILRYAPKEHVYYLVNGESLEVQDGVTSICHVIDKSEALIPWAVKQMAAKLFQTAPSVHLPSGDHIIRQMDFSEFEKLVLEAKGAHKEKLEEAGNVGHIAHAWIEDLIKAKIAGDRAAEVNQLCKFPDDERARNCCIAACEWMARHNVRWISTERKIYSRKYKYAGTMDGLCIVDSCSDPHCCGTLFSNRLTVADWKSSNYLYSEYLFQTAAYQQAFMEETGEQVQDRWVIRLGKEDGEFDPWHAGVETFEQDWEAFRLCLMLTRQVRDIKQRIKEKAQALALSIKAEKKAARDAKELAEKEAKASAKAEKKRERLEALVKRCKGADKYKGTRKPNCNQGKACESCLAKYAEVQGAKPERPFKQPRVKKEKAETEAFAEQIADWMIENLRNNVAADKESREKQAIPPVRMESLMSVLSR